ncbi:MAG: methyltransferase domain-containing protein [Spirulina sp. SIO3F2]|nr:methyltransferase domain-containing protein [Spirulina sp. SIO3F2]
MTNPTTASYAFAPIDPAFEQARLRALEAAFDPTTHQWLQQAGLAPGQTCLELGPGAGSIAQWLSNAVTATGRVVAIDRDPTHWQEIQAPNLEKVITDLSQWDWPIAQFDLIHARYVLVHIPQAITLLPQLWAALKPGGTLVLEEPDFSLARFVHGPADMEPAVQQVNRAIAAMFTQKGLDPAWALQMPAQLAAANFSLESSQVEAHLCPGHAPIARLMEQSAQVLAAQYLATGEATPEALDAYCAAAHNPKVWAIYYTTVRAIARRSPG